LRDKTWNRPTVIEQLRGDIWRHLSQAARTEDIALEASRLLQMSDADVRALAQLQFVLSREVQTLLRQMPSLVRRLSTTTVNEREVSAERVRGAIRWAETYSTRAAVGLPHLFVTTPTRRAFDTPENRVLSFALDSVVRIGRLTGWEGSTSEGVGEVVHDRVGEATRWVSTRALSDLDRSTPAAKTVARVRAGRRRHLYEAALAVFQLHDRMIARLDRGAIRAAVENHAIVTREDPVLLELLCAFRAMESLTEQGWLGKERGLVGGGEIFRAKRDGRTLHLYFQRAPTSLSTGSLYRHVQGQHEFSGTGGLIPDLVIATEYKEGPPRWLMLEVKGVEDSAAGSARRAARDLLMYRRAFDPILGKQEGVYGIGIAWGADIRPATAGDEILLCSPDTLGDALEIALSDG
jgi:hypothetical protein